MSNALPTGLVLVQRNPEKAVDLTGGPWHGWLFWKHPDGQFVSERKLEPWEIMQAEDQRDENIVLNLVGQIKPDKPTQQQVEKFVIKHYSEDERTTIKGNGFDGLEIGHDREEAQEFVDFINNLIEEKK